MMRILKRPFLGLALLAGACGVADTSSQSTSPSKNSSTSTDSEPDIPVIVFKGESPPPKKEPAPRTVPAPAKESQDAALQRDLQRLQGTWTALDIEHDGGKESPSGGLKWVIRDDQYEVWIDNQKLETNQFALDPTRRPKTLEMRHVASGSKGPRITGIYELQGDTLKLCYDLTGQGYPKDFSAPKGARRISYLFLRN